MQVICDKVIGHFPVARPSSHVLGMEDPFIGHCDAGPPITFAGLVCEV
jgi:hypothetical protein